MLEATSQFPLPKNLDLPVFVYGLLKRGELGHGQVKEFLVPDKPILNVEIAGLELLILDGLSYAVISHPNKLVSGQLLEVQPEAYERIIRFENYGAEQPKYVWAEVDGPHGKANTLISAARTFSSRHELAKNWSILDDKFYVEGIPWVRSQIGYLRSTTEDSPGKLFFALASFWITAVTFERTLAFCFGIPPLGEGSGIRTTIRDKISKDSGWIEAFESSGVATKLPGQTQDLQEFFTSWTDFRNRSVKGKPGTLLAPEVVSKTETMVDFLENFLSHHSPALAREWGRQSGFPSEMEKLISNQLHASKVDFIGDGLAWCHQRLSELRSKFERGKQIAEGAGSVSLQATFLVGWSLFETLLKTTYPNYVDTRGAIADQLSNDPLWGAVILRRGPFKVRWIWSQFNPVKPPQDNPFCFEAWLNLRNNVMHRGKSANREFSLVLEAAENLIALIEEYWNSRDAGEESGKGD